MSTGKIIPAYKPIGLSSAALVVRYRQQFPGQKVGHAGSLDPLAEGLLLILVGAATKKQARLMRQHKEYRLEIIFGLESASDDREGPLRWPPFPNWRQRLGQLNLGQIRAALGHYRGKFWQTVPAFSAVKVDGQPLYRRARQGTLPAKLPRRPVHLFRVKILSWQPQKQPLPTNLDPAKALALLPRLNLKLEVGKGFYLRSLARDLGRDLQVGGLVSWLCRQRIGRYHLPEGTCP